MDVDCVEETGAEKWKVQSLYEFQYYNCPDCTYKSRSKQEFAFHIHENHSEALYTWKSKSITYGPTDGRTGVGARVTCMSKNNLLCYIRAFL